MDGIPLRKFLFLTLTAAAFTLASCGQALKSDKQRALALDNGGSGGAPEAGGTDGGGEVVDSAGFFIKVVDQGSVVLTKNLHKTAKAFGANLTFPETDLTTELTSECKVETGTTGAAADITCILEIEELDLYFNPIALQIHVPSSMCNYVRERPYSFYAYEPGQGPDTTSHQILADGTIVDVTNTLNGEPVCQFDYTEEGGPNCCVGSFQQIVTDFTSDPADTNVTLAEWGGTVAACLTGPAMVTQSKSPQGAPLSTTTYVEGTGINKTYTIPAARAQTLAQQGVSSNVWAASFYNPGEHGGALTSKPAPLRTVQPSVPAALQIAPFDHYEVQCLDRAEDLNARIRLMVRDWNIETISGTTDADQGGTDPGFPDANLNDRLDWFDFEDLGISYPESLI
jgi:hypothetical protein